MTMPAPATPALQPGEALVQIRDLKVHFPLHAGVIIQRQVGR